MRIMAIANKCQNNSLQSVIFMPTLRIHNKFKYNRNQMRLNTMLVSRNNDYYEILHIRSYV